MLPDNWRDVRQVLVIRVGSAKDLLFTIPALQMLRQLLPDAAITLLTSPLEGNASVSSTLVDDVLVYEGEELALIAMLRERAFDAALIFTNPRESPYPIGYICYLAGIPIRVGQSQEFGGGVLSHCVKPLPESHPLDHHLFLLKSVFSNSLCDHYASSPGISTVAISTT